jgi:hypothetical protein
MCLGDKTVARYTDCDGCPEPDAYEPSEAADRYHACLSCLQGCIHQGTSRERHKAAPPPAMQMTVDECIAIAEAEQRCGQTHTP